MSKSNLAELTKGVWKENPIFALVIGMCPSMAVTNSVKNALVMSLATAFVLICSSVMISALRKVIPGPIRISVYIIIIATFVSVVDWTLAGTMPAAHKRLGAFIALIVVNCIILGRAEAFASRNAVWPSVLDAVGMSLGFGLALTLISLPRELLGAGSILGFDVMGPRFEPWIVMILPPGGFLTLAAELALLKAWQAAREKKQQASIQLREAA